MNNQLVNPSETYLPTPTLACRVWIHLAARFGLTSDRGQIERFVLLTALSCGFISICAQTPLPYTQMSLQSAGLILIGIVFGRWPAVTAVLLWLCLGGLGWTVFLNGSGLTYMLGPTGGYLAGGLISVWLLGWWADCGRLTGDAVAVGLKLFGLALGAHLVIFAFGLVWLSQFVMIELKASGFGSLETVVFGTVSIGLTPFLWGAALQCLGIAIGMAWLHWLVPEYSNTVSG